MDAVLSQGSLNTGRRSRGLDQKRCEGGSRSQSDAALLALRAEEGATGGRMRLLAEAEVGFPPEHPKGTQPNRHLNSTYFEILISRSVR